MGEVKIDGYICERCGHQWVSRGKEEPRVCPKCKSAWWNRPRKNKIKKRALFGKETSERKIKRRK